jgi:hypothetical protein
VGLETGPLLEVYAMGFCFQTLHLDADKSGRERDSTMNLSSGWVWVVIRRDDDPSKDHLHHWHLQGIADDEEIAISLCIDHTYLIGPLPRNTALPVQRIEWIGSYFPLAKD